jgi:pimeloyl-ACP methyl ester carboxylesterase
VAGQAHPRAVTAWTPAAGVRLHARILRPEGASAGLVVMMHGLGVSAGSLSPLAERLAERHAVVVWDLPGFGRSDADRVWSTSDAAEAVALGMERRSLGGATLVAHSWGCKVAAMLALRHAGRVDRLVMLSPAFSSRFGGPVGQVLRLAVDAPMERPSLVAGAVRDYLRAGPGRVFSTLREACTIPLDDLVGELKVPLMVVRGSRDPLTTGRWAAHLAARAGGPATVAVIPRAAHGLGHDAPRAVARAIEAFLDA